MSLYLGRNAASGSPIIATVGSHTLAEMTASTQPADTIFSTTVPVCYTKIFECSNITFTNERYFHNIVTAKLTTDCIDYINSKTTSTHVPVVMYAINGKILLSHGRVYNNSAFVYMFTSTNVLTAGVDVSYNMYPSTTYCYKMLIGSEVGVTSTPSSVSVLVFNLLIPKVHGVGLPLYSPLPFNGSGEVILRSDEIIVEGISLADHNSISLINTNSSTMYFNRSGLAKFYVSNYATGNTGVELIANSTEVTLRNKNNELIFSSNIGKTYINGMYTSPVWVQFKSTSRGLHHYIDNVPVTGSSTFITYFSGNEALTKWDRFSTPFGVSSFFRHEDTPIVLYDLTVTASQTTYSYTMSVKYVAGILRYVSTVDLVYMGVDGNPGFPPPTVSLTNLFSLYS